MHKIRFYVDPNSEISDEELDELYAIFHEAGYYNDDYYDYRGNFILTTDVAERDEKVCSMCCGIITRDITLKNGKAVYFAFDYGH